MEFKPTAMKSKFNRFIILLLTVTAMVSCEKSVPPGAVLQDGNNPEASDLHGAKSDFVQTGDITIHPVQATLVSLPNENFVADGQDYYCYLLKLEKVYPADVIHSKSGEPLQAMTMDLSYSLNFKLYTTQQNGPDDEEFAVEFLDDLELYYRSMAPEAAISRRTNGFLQGDITLDSRLDADEYKQYLGSQVRLKSGTLHLKKIGNDYQVSFSGTTETGQVVSSVFNKRMSYQVDERREIQDYITSAAEVPENYIFKGGRYYRLDAGRYQVYAPAGYQDKMLQTIQVMNFRDYYRYENSSPVSDIYEGIFLPHWKSNAIVLQFQMTSVLHFQPGTYTVAPSDGILTIGYGPGATSNVALSDFPDNTKLIGYYHTSTYLPNTFTLDEDPGYMQSQIALKSGQFKLSKDGAALEISGRFTDAQGGEAEVKFKAYPSGQH